LQFSGNDFRGHMRLVHRFVRHVGAHLNVDVDEATVGDSLTGQLT
jgi:hypothetical protein